MTGEQAPAPKKRGVRLSPEEAWATIEASHTGIFTTLRRDGVPISLPVWFVVLDGTICMTTPGGTKKVARVRHDARSSFLVESGERWAELKAVHLTGRAEIVDDPELAERARAASEAKYAAFRTAPSVMPDATRKHYSVTSALIRFVPDERIVSWDNVSLFG
jgi:nitroimidazol reductase NimA-like FMN-containing flavoprotein (pyridoxamine 5'-phosphate oxidase superfamily)